MNSTMANKESEVSTLFPETIVSDLDERQSQLNAGQGFEVANTKELLAKIEENATIRAAA